MSVSSNIDPVPLFEKYKTAKQDHVFTYWPALSPSERNSLISQLSAIDIERANVIYKRAMAYEQNASATADIEPLPKDRVESIVATTDPTTARKVDEWRTAGLKAIASNRVGVLLMAGGQGTRLGSSAPKGCYDIGLPSRKSLFQYQAERIKRLQTVAAKSEGKKPDQVVIPWYVMTSGPTRTETQAFFEKHGYFGLDKSNVVFFEQGTLPCFTLDGKIMLESASKVAVAPDGNGGLYAALRQPLSSSEPNRSVLSDLRSRKVDYIHAYCVDNCLVKVADPVFIGYNIHTGAECAAKVVPKSSPTESVGVIALKNGKYFVVEYSEITKEQSEKRDPSGELTFRAANIVNHFYTTSFLERVKTFEEEMPFHVARKKIPYVPTPALPSDFSLAAPHPSSSTALPQTVKATSPNGFKLELFVFDVFPFAKTFSVLEVLRSDEFSPLKNAPGTGSDDPGTSRRDLLRVQKGWLENAGAGFEANVNVEIEVSPLVSYSGEGLEALRNVTFKRSGVLESLDNLKTLTA